MSKHKQTVLGLYPSSRGFGWALFEGPSSLFDWSTADVRRDRNAGSISRIEELFDKYGPAVLALETFEKVTTGRAGRIRKLSRDIVRAAQSRGIAVHIYSRAEIAKAFGSESVVPREKIAAAVAERAPALADRLPKPRKIWESESPNMALFAAAACALTYYDTMPT
jgi:hypothetical protein